MDLKEIITQKRSVAVFIIIAAVAAYAPALNGGFIWEDIKVFFGASDYIPFFENAFHRPLYEVSMVLDHRVWGENPVGFHITNVLVHAASSILVFVLGVYLFEGTLLPFLAALLFALHPVNTEAVSWVSARAELLMTAFFLAAFILYLQYKKEGRTAALIASMLFFLLSALSRQAALIFPLFILAYEVTLKATSLRDTAERKKLYLAAGSSALTAALYLAFFRGTGEFFPAGGFALKQLSNSLSALGYYLVKLAVPLHLNFLPTVPDGIIYAIVALLPLGVAAVLYSEGKRRLVFLVSWTIITLLPSILTAMTDIEYPVGERFLYLPSAGFCLLLAAGAGAVGNKKIIAAVFVPLLALYTAGTFDRVQTWKDEVSLWKDTAGKTSGHSLPHINHAYALIKNGMQEEGKKALKTAIRQDGITHEELALAMKLFSLAGEKDPEAALLESLVEIRGKARAYYGLGFIHYNLYTEDKTRPRHLHSAIDYFEKALGEEEDFMNPHYYLGLSYLNLRNLEKAEEHFKLTRELDFDGRYRVQTDDFLMLIQAYKNPVPVEQEQ